MCPSSHEIWEFFSCNMLPVIRKWKLESAPVTDYAGVCGAVDAINTLLSTVVAHLEQDSSYSESGECLHFCNHPFHIFLVTVM